MKNSFIRILNLLAASGFKDHEIYEFFREARHMPPSELVDVIEKIRYSLNSEKRVPFDDEYREFSSSSADVELKVERLLIHEAGMSRAEAVDRLSSMLQSRFPNIEIPAESRKGFRQWVARLTFLLPEKELLHVATTLRNKVVHEAPADWRLK